MLVPLLLPIVCAWGPWVATMALAARFDPVVEDIGYLSPSFALPTMLADSVGPVLVPLGLPGGPSTLAIGHDNL